MTTDYRRLAAVARPIGKHDPDQLRLRGRRLPAIVCVVADTTPDPDLVASELRVVIQVGLRESALARRSDSLAALLELSCMQPPRGVPERPYYKAKRLASVLRDEIIKRRIEEQSLRQGLTMLFGATDLLATLSPVARREEAARILSLGEQTSDNFLKRHEPDYRSLIADKLIDFSFEYLHRNSFNQMKLGEPTDPGVAIDWLDRFQYYYRIWAYLSGLANDITAIAVRREQTTSDAAIHGLYLSSLWFFACFQLNLDRFIDERGGLWLVSNADIEQEIADQTYYVGFLAAPTTKDRGWLSLAATRDGTMPNPLAFSRTVHATPSGRAILKAWTEWIRTCGCKSDEPLASCEVHKVREHCRRYMNLVDQEWFKVATWYQNPPTQPLFDAVDLTALYADFPSKLVASIDLSDDEPI